MTLRGTSIAHTGIAHTAPCSEGRRRRAGGRWAGPGRSAHSFLSLNLVVGSLHWLGWASLHLDLSEVAQEMVGVRPRRGVIIYTV